MTVENASYRWSYLFLSFGLLGIVAFRSFIFDQASWDLLALVILSGAVNAAYQAWHRVVYTRWMVVSAVTLVTATLLAAIMVFVKR